MAKFCGNCGNRMEDSEVFCGQCGTKSDVAPVAPAAPVAPVAPVAPAAPAAPVVPAAPVAPAAPKEPSKFALWLNNFTDNVMELAGKAWAWIKAKPLNMGIAIGGAVAVVALIVLAIIFLGGGGEEGAVKTYVNVCLKGDFDDLEDMAPEAVWEYIDDEYGADVDDCVKVGEEKYKDSLDEMEDEYGQDISISYEIIEIDEVSKTELKLLQASLKADFGIPVKDITAASEVEIEYTIAGDDDEETDDTKIIVVEIDGDWYPVSGGSFFPVYLARSVDK